MPARTEMPVKLVAPEMTSLPTLHHLSEQSTIPSSVVLSTVEERLLHEESNISPDRGYEYIAGLSRRRFALEREDLRYFEPNTDCAVITSDTALLIERDGQPIVVNEYTPPEEVQGYLDDINRAGKITLIGASTFGRKQGESMMSVLTFAEFPISQPITELPKNQRDLTAYKDPNQDAVVGYIQPEIGDGGHIKYTRKIHQGVYPNPEGEADPALDKYTTGLPDDVLKLAERTAIFDREVAPIMEESVGAHPFNTLAFYSGFKKSGLPDLRAYYDQILANPDAFFRENGGNCTFFVLDMEGKIRERGYETAVATYSSDQPRHQEGHGVLIAKDQDGQSFFIDPGLSFTYPIPISKDVPLFPVVFGGSKIVLLDVAYMNDDGTPDLIILKGNKKIVLPGKNMMTVDAFREIVPRVLTELHDLRGKAKVDYHDNHGVKRGSVNVDIATGDVGIQVGTRIRQYSPDQLLGDTMLQAQLHQDFAEQGIDFAPLLTQLEGYLL